MTELKDNILCLDLSNDQKARDVAFSYATTIMVDDPELADRILSTVEEIENDLHGTKPDVSKGTDRY